MSVGESPMSNGKKVLGDERRDYILKILKETQEPITGSELAKKMNVSRQVIVGDMTLLKAKNEPIIATSQGYIYLPPTSNKAHVERIIACNHLPNEAEAELNIIVDYGITVKDVKIEHPVYGDLTASIMVSNRKEVKQFIEKVNATKAAFLSELTNGFHLHTLIGPSQEALDEAEAALRQAGFLVE